MTSKRSAFTGLHCTHVRAREDAVIYQGREYVPTVSGQPTGNTKWVGSLKELSEVGGNIIFNEDQTEIHLVLPVGHKFSIQMLDQEKAAKNLIAALKRCADYLGEPAEPAGYPSVHNAVTNALIRDVRAAIAKADGRP